MIWSGQSLALLPPVVLPRRRGRPILAYLSRPPPAIKDGLASCQAVAVLNDLDARPATLHGDLIWTFALTPAEARLAAQLATGDSLEMVADQLGIAYETARNVLKSVFQKTDTNRQTQLMALLARFGRRPADVKF